MTRELWAIVSDDDGTVMHASDRKMSLESDVENMNDSHGVSYKTTFHLEGPFVLLTNGSRNRKGLETMTRDEAFKRVAAKMALNTVEHVNAAKDLPSLKRNAEEVKKLNLQACLRIGCGEEYSSALQKLLKDT